MQHGVSKWLAPIAGTLVFGLVVSEVEAENFTTNTVNTSSNVAASTFVVGDTGSLNFLQIVSGGSLTNNTGAIGNTSSASSNTVLVTGSTALWTNKSNLLIGDAGVFSQLVVTNGGRVFSNGGTIGRGASANDNSVLVKGANSLWNDVGSLVIGQRGARNRLEVRDGGQVLDTDAIIGNQDGDNNAVLVTGSGSTWITVTLTIGPTGAPASTGNRLTIDSGASVIASNLVLAGGKGNQYLTNSSANLFVTNAQFIGALTIGQGTGMGTFTATGTSTTSVDRLIVAANGFITFDGGVINTKTSDVVNAVRVGDGSTAATLNLIGGGHSFTVGLNITNNGTLNLVSTNAAGGAAATILNQLGSAVLTNRAGGMITGGGVIQNNNQIVNLGSIIATSAVASLRFTNANTVGNAGTLGASTGGTLIFGSATGSAAVTNFGTIELTGGTLLSGNITNLAFGVIRGSGTFGTTVINLGSLRATNGTLALTVGLTNASTGNIDISPDGTLTVTPAWVNAGTVTHKGGTLVGGNITNLAGARMGGTGTITANIVNQGGVSATNGQLRLLGAVSGVGAYQAVAGASASTLSFVGGGSLSALYNTGATIRVEGLLTNASIFVNAGTLALMGGTYYSTANVTNSVGAFIVNQGTLNAPVINSGSMLVTNGTLLLSAGLTNASTGNINISSGSTLSVTPAWANAGVVDVSGGILAGGANITNTATGVVRGFGTVTNAALINSGTIFANSGSALTLDSARVANSGVVTADAGGLIVRGAFVNSGTVTMQHSAGTFNNIVVNSGRWVTDPSTNVFVNDYTNTTTGVISMSLGDVYIFTTNTGSGSTVGSFVDSSTNNAANAKLSGKFLFDNHTLSLTQNFYAAGHDMNQGQATSSTNQIVVASLSPLPAGYVTNFSLGTLEIANFSTVRVWDAFSNISPGTDDNLRAALYVTNLLMSANSYLIISSNLSVYFLTSNSWGAANFDLLGGSLLADQGQLHQFAMLSAVPEPGVLVLWMAGGATVYLAGRRRNRNGVARR